MSLSIEQIDERKPFITASEISAIVGVSKWSTPYDVFNRKTSSTEITPATIAMDLGSALQKPFLEVINKHHGFSFVNNDDDVLVIHKSLPYCAATPDGIEPDRIAEVKIVGPNTAKDWSNDADGIPPYVLCQVQWQMACVGVDECVVIALVWGAPRLYYIKYNNDLFLKMHSLAVEFWERHIITGEPPSGAPEFCIPQKTQKIVEVDIEDYELQKVCRDYKNAKTNAANAVLVKTQAEKIIKNAIGENEGLRFGNLLFTYRADKNGKRRFSFKKEE